MRHDLGTILQKPERGKEWRAAVSGSRGESSVQCRVELSGGHLPCARPGRLAHGCHCLTTLQFPATLLLNFSVHGTVLSDKIFSTLIRNA